VIPGIIFCIWFSLAPYVFVVENAGPIEALKKSKEYISGKFFEVFYRILGIIFVTAILMMILYLIPMINLSLLPIVSIFLALLIPLVISAIIVIYLVLLYENLKALKGRAISNPINKIFMTLIILILFLIIIFPFIFFAANFGSSLIKDMKRPVLPAPSRSVQKRNDIDQSPFVAQSTASAENNNVNPNITTNNNLNSTGSNNALNIGKCKAYGIKDKNENSIWFIAAGELVSSDNKSLWIIKLDQLNPRYGINIDSDTQFVGKQESAYKVGDCLIAAIRSSSFKATAISPQ
jgi:glucan phosphoethanolaminetransferase (alkaline phosphatase superfamily)